MSHPSLDNVLAPEAIANQRQIHSKIFHGGNAALL